MINDITIKLQQSEAVKSLNFENKVRDILHLNGWNCFHSPYFQDTTTKKLREIDILAKMRFQTKNQQKTIISSEINLLVESKSLSGYHIICDAEIISGRFHERNFEVWMGYDSYNHDTRLIEILNKTSLNDIQKKEVIDVLHKKLFQNGYMIVGDYRPNPFNKISYFTTFRETNIGSTKNLDNSVLWKSFQSLNAACEGYKSFIWQRIESNLLGQLNYIINFSEDLKITLDKIFDQHFDEHTCLHKILVIDADLWRTNNGKMEKLPHFRLLQRDVLGHIKSWIDVVNQDFFEEYCISITNHYNTFFESADMKRIP